MDRLYSTEGLSPIQVVKHYFQDMSHEDAEEFLFGETLYPFGSMECIHDDIYVSFINSKQEV